MVANHLFKNRFIPFLAAALLGMFSGLFFFIAKGSPESAVIQIRPALIYSLQTGEAGFRQMDAKPVENSDQFQARLKKYLSGQCSPTSKNIKIDVRSNSGTWEYIVQRSIGQDSFSDAINCALQRISAEHSEIVKFLSGSRKEPLPSALAHTEITEILVVQDHTQRLKKLNLVRAIVIGLIVTVFVYFSIRFFTKNRNLLPL